MDIAERPGPLALCSTRSQGKKKRFDDMGRLSKWMSDRREGEDPGAFAAG